jgi:prefoldin subunit 5
MQEFFSTAWATIAEYGPFPVGIIVGIILARGAYNKAFSYLDEEKKELRNEKKELRETIQAQQERIDKLHDQLYQLEELKDD